MKPMSDIGSVFKNPLFSMGSSSMSRILTLLVKRLWVEDGTFQSSPLNTFLLVIFKQSLYFKKWHFLPGYTRAGAERPFLLEADTEGPDQLLPGTVCEPLHRTCYN